MNTMGRCLSGFNTASKVWADVNGYCLVGAENFKTSEFECKCGCGTNKEKPAHIMNLQVARNTLCRKYGRTIRIVVISGTRCTTHNKNVGGVKDSTHLLSYASDIYSPDLPTRELYYALKKMDIFSTLIYYKGKNSIHADSREGRYPAYCRIKK